MDFWNFKDIMIVPSHYWVWMILALLLGVIVGWMSCRWQETRR